MTGRNVRPIWTPRDAVDTARQFHLEIDNAERGDSIDPAPQGHWWLTRSRERRARILDALAVLLLLATTAFLGCAVVMLSTGTAKGDTNSATAYGWEMAGPICDNLDHFDASDAAFIGTAQGIVELTGMTWGDAGTAIYTAVDMVCPRHMGRLMSFVRRHSPAPVYQRGVA